MAFACVFFLSYLDFNWSTSAGECGPVCECTVDWVPWQRHSSLLRIVKRNTSAQFNSGWLMSVGLERFQSSGTQVKVAGAKRATMPHVGGACVWRGTQLHAEKHCNKIFFHLATQKTDLLPPYCSRDSCNQVPSIVICLCHNVMNRIGAGVTIIHFSPPHLWLCVELDYGHPFKYPAHFVCVH